MHRLLNVALREFTETIRTKLFIVSLFLTPAIIAGAMFVSRYVNEYEGAEKDAKTVAVLDRSGSLEAPLTDALKAYNAADPQRPLAFRFTTNETALEALQAQVSNDEIAGVADLSADIARGSAESFYYSKAQKVEDMQIATAVRGVVQQAVNRVRFEQNNVSPLVVARITQPIALTTLDVSGEEQAAAGEGLRARLVTAFIFVAMLFLSMLATSQGMLTTVIEEKNTRIVEVLLSAVSPFELMAGKIIGLATVGLGVMVLWVVIGYVTAVTQGYGDYVYLAGLHYYAAFYLLGFVLFASIYAAVGASCNSVQETQSLMTPLMLLVFSPMFVIRLIIEDPNGVVPTVFSFIPITAPMVVPLRIAADPTIPAWQIWASIIVLALSVPAVMWVASRIFRVGILMYGKPASLRELARWVRQT